MRNRFMQPTTSDGMNRFGLFFALFASMIVVVLLLIALFAIGR